MKEKAVSSTLFRENGEIFAPKELTCVHQQRDRPRALAFPSPAVIAFTAQPGLATLSAPID